MATTRRKNRPVPPGKAKRVRRKQAWEKGKWLESSIFGEREGNKSRAHQENLAVVLPGTTAPEYLKLSDIQQSHEPAQGFEESLGAFVNELDQVLTKRAQEKGYHSQGLNGRQLYDFVHDLASNGHALGEIIYKAIRFNRRKNIEDLVKIAAWAFLLWDKMRRNEVQS